MGGRPAIAALWPWYEVVSAACSRVTAVSQSAPVVRCDACRSVEVSIRSWRHSTDACDDGELQLLAKCSLVGG